MVAQSGCNVNNFFAKNQFKKYLVEYFTLFEEADALLLKTETDKI